ncbi:putative transcriptional regulatory protein YLL054C [Talaromyces islandicus]|uniref:Putative transcriptional regulatory protein YLL054C n=1 Tax=Talaromyces islandicus TaxID=28573 RepID=A0A0U1LK43_TALIS|nr:putative transcriptional regulatory protein YLL054C [Talaromyces islandicus]
MVVNRRSHCKSRHGCLNCKQRRVKCDETRPSCLNCGKRNATCIYEAAVALVWKEENAPTKRSPKNQRSDIFTILDGMTVSQGGSTVPPMEDTVLNLELMMHWCNHTHKTPARNEATAWIWRQLVPQEAFSHQFLLWAMLALSALDLARSKQDGHRSMYLNTAALYQTRALTLFRQVLQDVNPSNAKAIFAFSAIVAVYAFGSCDGPNMSDPIQDINHVLMLVRGTSQVIACVSPTLLDNEFAPLLQVDEDQREITPDVAAALTHLHTLNDSIQNGIETHIAYREAIQRLGEMIATFHSGKISMTLCGKWAIKLSPLFLDCLQERQPLALIVLAHYCVLLHYLRRYWCLAPWPTRVFQAVWDTLDEKGQESLRWPMEQIFSQDHSSGE